MPRLVFQLRQLLARGPWASNFTSRICSHLCKRERKFSELLEGLKKSNPHEKSFSILVTGELFILQNLNSRPHSTSLDQN